MSLFNRILQLMMKIPALQNIRLAFYFFDAAALKFIKKPKKSGGKKKVLIVFPFALGDCVMFLSSAGCIRDMYPADEWEVVAACNGPYAELFKTAFDRVITCNFTKASVAPGDRLKMLKIMRSEYFDVAIDPIGANVCSPNVYATNAVCAGEKIGVLLRQDKKLQCPAWLRRKAYDKILTMPEKDMHKIRHYYKVFEMLSGRKYEPRVASLPVGNTVELPEKFFIVYPSASIPVKQWPVDRYAAVTRKIYEKLGCPLVICGTGLDKEISEQLIGMLPDIPVVNIIGKTSVMQFVEVIGRAQLVLTNDTSVYHIAVATGRRTCVVSGGYVYDTFLDYLSNGYGEYVESHTRVVAHRSECMNCDNSCIHKVDVTYPCVEENTAEEVQQAVLELIDME